MAWVKLDDQFPDHPKIIAAGGEAAWLYVAGLCYCSAKLTDGMIPSAMISRLTDRRNAPKLADKLVEVGLWEHADGGYMVHDYGDYQPLASLVRARRESETEAKRVAGKLGGVASGIARAKAKQTASTNEAESKQTASRLVEAETKPRPDPSPRASDEARKNLPSEKSDGGVSDPPPARRGRPPKPGEPMPFTIAEACATIRHGVLVDPFPKEPKYATRLTALVRQYPSLAMWRKVADKLAEGLDGWGGGYRGDKPDLGTLLTRFGAWVQQAEAMAPAMRNDAPPPDPNGGLPFDPEWIANGKPWRLGPDGKTLV